MNQLSETTQNVLNFLQKTYVQKGYDGSGSMKPEEIQNELKLEGKEELEKALSELLEGKLIQKQPTDNTRLELSYGERKKLIQEHDLGTVWEKVAPEYIPNDKDFGEVPVTLFLAYISQ